MITHLRRVDGEHEQRIHISHLFQYVSAYEYSKETLADLSSKLEQALRIAKAETRVVIVDLDGECCFHVMPFGKIVLMLPWKQYEVAPEES